MPAARVATNAMNGNMWDDFASDELREPAVDRRDPFYNPYRRESDRTATGSFLFAAPQDVRGVRPRGGGGPGFYRVPTLVSIWATAPFLHNNSLGKFQRRSDTSRAGSRPSTTRIRKLLWKERAE